MGAPVDNGAAPVDNRGRLAGLLAGFEKVALLGGQYVPLESRRTGDSERVRGVAMD